MPEIRYLRESAGAVGGAINLVSAEKKAADWVQAVAGGAITLKDAGGTSVSIANAAPREVFYGPFTEITSSAGKLRYGAGHAPPIMPGGNGADGADGQDGEDGAPGVSPKTTTFGTFTRAATNTNNTCVFNSYAQFAIGTILKITDSTDTSRFAHVEVVSVDNPMTLKSLGYTGDIAAASTIAGGAYVGVVGARGAPGDATAYTPGTAGDWAGTPPATIGAALDRCAALLKSLNSGTGP